jgi:GNAT superfamily N-acetyltransferase
MSLNSSSPKIEFQLTEASDAQAMASLRVEAMRPSLEAIGRFDPDRARQRFLSQFEAQYSHHIIFGEERVGFVVVKPIETGLLLEHLYVRPDWQSHGIGAAALRWVFAKADAAKQQLRVGALVQSRSNQFYSRHGFTLVEETALDNYYIRNPAN